MTLQKLDAIDNGPLVEGPELAPRQLGFVDGDAVLIGRTPEEFALGRDNRTDIGVTGTGYSLATPSSRMPVIYNQTA